jgi:hypothetical protein
MSGPLPTVARGQVEINDHLEHFKIPLSTRHLLIAAVAVREAEGATAESAIRNGYVAIRAGEGRPIACYAHRTQVSLSLDPDVAESVCRAHRFCLPEPNEHNATPRHVRIKHADIRMYSAIVGELLLVALQRSWDRFDLAGEAAEEPPSLAASRPAAAARVRSSPASRPATGSRSSSRESTGARPASAGGTRTGARTSSSAPAPQPRPAPAMCPIHFHPLINGECDYCA